jgi:predicted transcriptional regulator
VWVWVWVIGSLVIVDEQKRLKGIVSVSDILSFLLL